MTRHVLMCPPRHFTVSYEINPWMHREDAPDARLAMAQWTALYDRLIALGVKVQLVEQEPGLPDMTFTANAGVVAGRLFLPSNFRHAERQLEEAHFRAWFEKCGYAVRDVAPGLAWEGEGDVLWSPNGVFGGYGFRTDRAALDSVERSLGVAVTRLELTDPRFYHLDTCFCPIDERVALYHPSAFSPADAATIAARFPGAIAVMEADALRFACNALVTGKTVVLNAGCPATVTALEAAGYTCVETPTGEFIKAGGSVKCLVLTLDAFGEPPLRSTRE